MAEESPWIDVATGSPGSHDSAGPFTRLLDVSLTATNYIAQYPGGAAIADTTGPWTAFSPTRLPQIVYSGGAAPTYTLTGTSAVDGSTITEAINATAGAGTYKATQPYATITGFSSDIDPVGTTDLQAGDTWVYPAARGINVGVSGVVACRPMENSADAAPLLQAGINGIRLTIVRITSTTATNLALGW